MSVVSVACCEVCVGPIHKNSIESVYVCITECDPCSLQYEAHPILKNLIGPQLVKKFPAFYETRRLITAFTKARHLSLS